MPIVIQKSAVDVVAVLSSVGSLENLLKLQGATEIQVTGNNLLSTSEFTMPKGKATMTMETLPFEKGHKIQSVTIPHSALSKGVNLKIQHLVSPITDTSCKVETSYQVDWTKSNPLKSKIEAEVKKQTIEQLKTLYKYLKS